MAETYTKRGRATKQEYGSNPEAWGGELNEGALEIEDAMWGTTEVVVSGTVTLTANNKIADQSREFVQIMTGTGGTVIFPAVDKPYFFINNCSGDVLAKPGIAGTGVTVRAGTAVAVYTNAAGTTAFAIDMPLNMFKAPTGPVAMGGQKITGLAQGAASSSDAPTVQQVSDMIASAGSISGLPPLTGNALRFLQVNSGATAIQWAVVSQTAIFPLVAVSANTAIVVNTVYWVNSTSGVITMTLPAVPANGDTAVVVREGANNVIVARNGNNIALLAEDNTIDSTLLAVVYKFVTGTGWRIFSVTGVA